MKRSLKKKISLAILGIVLLTVTVISFLSNYFINLQFTDYIARQQELKSQVIQSGISQQFNLFSKKWDRDFIHAIGMFSLYEGYIIQVYDKDNNILWDALAHDMVLCNQIMKSISDRMRIKYPQLEGEFISESYPLEQAGEVIGSVSISYFGPFFLNENDFRFLNSLNTILLSVGFLSLILSIVIGQMLAKRISRPILKTVEVTKQIADGNYSVRLEEEADTRELDMLVGSVNHLASSLETLEKLRKQLTEDVAHELRTPLAILQSHIEAIIEGVWEPTSERLQSCHDEVLRINRLVKDLEKLSKIESDNIKLEKKKLDMLELINRIAGNFTAEVKKKDINLIIQGPMVSVLADPDRMGQVIVNLLSNAVKYSKEGGSITISTFQTKNTAGFTVRDTGIGISEKELPYIFERFYRADKSRNRLTGGTGIGLTIVKSIVEAHGGRVKAESLIDQGSCFTIVLPLE